MADRKNAGITGSGGANVDPFYGRFPVTPPSKKLKPTILEPDLRPGGKYNPTKPKNTLDTMFNRKTK